MWFAEPTDEYIRRHRWYAKKKPRELRAVLDNLDTFLKSLQRGSLPQQIKAGYIHPEPHGVLAIDQKGGGKNLAQTRLYIFPYTPDEVLKLLTIGDKESQSEDIKYCGSQVAAFRKPANEQETKERPIQFSGGDG